MFFSCLFWNVLEASSLLELGIMVIGVLGVLRGM